MADRSRRRPFGGLGDFDQMSTYRDDPNREIVERQRDRIQALEQRVKQLTDYAVNAASIQAAPSVITIPQNVNENAIAEKAATLVIEKLANLDAETLERLSCRLAELAAKKGA